MLVLTFFTTILTATCLASTIPLLKCCTGSESYDLGSNQCVQKEAIPTWTPPIYSPEHQSIRWTTNRFNVTQSLIGCDDDSVAHSSTEMTLFEDGTLEIQNISTKFAAGSFCIEHSLQSDQFAALFCVPDVCKLANCLRKCCPIGFSYVGNNKTCTPSNSQFNLKFQNESGEQEPHVSLPMKTGTPNCPDGMFLLDPHAYPEDEFFVLSSGKIFVPSYQNDPLVDEYCLEDFLVDNENGTEEYQRKAIICSVPMETPGELLVITICIYLQFVVCFFLIATVVVYSIVPEIRNIHGINVMCHCISLASTFIFLGIIKIRNDLSTIPCILIAIAAHFSFLSSFTWLNVLSFDIWWSLTRLKARSTTRRYVKQSIRRRLPLYSCFGWGVPFIIVSTGQILTYVPGLPEQVVKPDFGVQNCWFPTQGGAILIYLYGPMSVLLIANVVFFILTAIRLHSTGKRRMVSNKHSRKRNNTAITFSIFMLMGVTWVTEIITWATEASPYYSMATDILNIVTGVFIFVIFVCKKEVMELLSKKFRRSLSGSSSTVSTKLTALPVSEDSSVVCSKLLVKNE